MGIKEGILGKLLLTGNTEQVNLLSKGLDFEWCRSKNNVFNGDCISLDWVIDQLKYHLDDVRRQGGYIGFVALWRLLVEQMLRESRFNGKPVLEMINGLVWECVRKEICSDASRVLRTCGDKAYELYYNIAQNMLTLVLMADNGLKWRDIEFGVGQRMILTDVASKHLYSISISKNGVMDIKRLADGNVRSSVYNIKKTVIKSVYGDINIDHIHKLTYGNLNCMFLDMDIKSRFIVHLVTETGIMEKTDWALVDSRAKISDIDFEQFKKRNYENTLQKVEM